MQLSGLRPFPAPLKSSKAKFYDLQAWGSPSFLRG